MSASDISRFLRQPGKHYAGARLQQGRILTDADFNEGSWLGEEDRRKALADFGPRGSPDEGFSIGAPLTPRDQDPAQPPALAPGDAVPSAPVLLGEENVTVRPVSIRAGAYYLGGMRFDLESPQPIMFQRDFLQMKKGDVPDVDLAVAGQSTLYYLNAWEQCVSAVEDGEFLEPALGGVDTSLRVRRMRRVQMRSNPSETSCADAFAGLIADLEATANVKFDRATGELKSTGRLFFTTAPGPTGPDCAACNPSPSARFLGADNQTLRLMLTSALTFVWGFDDGAPLYRALVSNLDEQNPTAVKVTLVTPPRDEEHFPLAGRVVEIIPFGALLDRQQVDNSVIDPHFNKAAAEIGAFTRVLTPYDPVTKSFTVDMSAGLDAVRGFVSQWSLDHPDAVELMVPPTTPPTTDRAFYVRFWQVAAQNQPIELPIDPFEFTGPALGTTGLVPNFTDFGRPGDFWIAGLRPDSPARPVVPFELFSGPNAPTPSGRAPDGPLHFLAPLAFVSGHIESLASPPDPDSVVDENSDCRLRIRPLADDGCTKITVGDCRTSVGEFDVIQDAIDALPPEGGVVTILPGFYQQTVQIINRPGVILEGCGAETVIQAPDDFENVITIAGASPGVRIRSLTLNTGAGGVVAIATADDLRLSDLTIVAAPNTSGGFPGPVSIQGSTGVTLEALRIEDGGRTGVLLAGCRGVEASGLEITGSTTATQDGGPPPAVRFDSCTTVTLRDSSVHTFGQVCVSAGNDCTDVLLERLTLTSEAFTGGLLLPALAAVDIGGATTVSLVKSGIRQLSVPIANLSLDTVGIDAAVVMQGNDLLVEDNDIVAPDAGPGGIGAGAWGGVQIRGNSAQAIVRGNHVSGGIGHGITLGSVIWQDAAFANPPQRFGAGKGQIDGSVSAGFGATGTVGPDQSFANLNPINEGLLVDVVVERNRIEQMSSNGVSVFAMLGVPFEANNSATEFIAIEGLRIEGNTITGNIAHPPSSLAISAEQLVNELMISPGITLDGPTGVGLQTHALAGIVLSDAGTGAEIRNNVITDNGTQQPVLPVSGIFIVVGEALTIGNNRILNNGAGPAGGVAQAAGVRGGIVVLYVGTGAPAALSELKGETFELGGNDLPNDGSSLRVLNNVVRHPEGRALYVIAAGPVSVTGNFFSTNGFHGSPQDQFALGDVILIQDIGGPWERFNVADLNRNETGDIFFSDYSTPPRTGDYLFNALPSSPRLFVGVGGQILFANNQVTYDWFVQRQPEEGIPLAVFPVALMTLDHASVVGNQLAFRVRGFDDPEAGSPLPNPGTVTEPVLAHLFVAGATLDVSGNRTSETFDLVYVSICTLGELINHTTYNQTTHHNFSEGNKVQALTEGNQVMFDNVSHSALDVAAHLFFRLLFRSGLNTTSDVIPPPPSG